MFLTEQIGTVT